MDILTGRPGWPSVLLARSASVAGDAGIDAAEAAGAWAAWKKTVAGTAPEALVGLIEKSGLRGRGGAGFPTGRKWRVAASQPAGQRWVVANGFEADPGAQTDRLLMERDPHAVVEGVALAAYAVGATQAIIVVNGSYGTAAARLQAAVDAAEAKGYLGDGLLGTSVRLSITVRALSGSLVTGEETVLLRALEDRRAQPDQKPPYPAVKGLWGQPTVVNNVQTLAAVPWIVTNGADAYAAIGAADAPGTMLVQLTGAVAKPGVVEVPLGTSLRDLLDLAGGAAGTLKALLVGGPTGGFLPADQLDLPLTFGALGEAGALVGSGTILAVGAQTSIVELATLLTRYLSDESCGKTIPCRIGMRRMAELGDGLCSGLCRPSDTKLLKDLAADIRDGGLCGLETGGVNPLLSGMRYFGSEFDAAVAPGSATSAAAAQSGSHA
ncbi:MAG: NADH-ubiquinone oxidoreductase-F iron-sulfur binding region domain-containing protein [Chloroflexota bacterium]